MIFFPSSNHQFVQYGEDTDWLIKDIAQVHRRSLVDLKSIDRLRYVLDDYWPAVFTLKKHSFPSKFFLLAGSEWLAETALPLRKETTTTPVQQLQQARGESLLRISQRLRLDATKIKEIEK